MSSNDSHVSPRGRGWLNNEWPGTWTISGDRVTPVQHTFDSHIRDVLLSLSNLTRLSYSTQCAWIVGSWKLLCNGVRINVIPADVSNNAPPTDLAYRADQEWRLPTFSRNKNVIDIWLFVLWRGIWVDRGHWSPAVISIYNWRFPCVIPEDFCIIENSLVMYILKTWIDLIIIWLHHLWTPPPRTSKPGKIRM